MEIPKQSVLSLVSAVLSDSGGNYPVCTQPVLSVCTYCVQCTSDVCPLLWGCGVHAWTWVLLG